MNLWLLIWQSGKHFSLWYAKIHFFPKTFPSIQQSKCNDHNLPNEFAFTNYLVLSISYEGRQIESIQSIICFFLPGKNRSMIKGLQNQKNKIEWLQVCKIKIEICFCQIQRKNKKISCCSVWKPAKNCSIYVCALQSQSKF